MKKLFTILAVLVSFTFIWNVSNAQLKLMSGFMEGSYFQMASELKKVADMDIDVIPSHGSRDNFFELRMNTIDVAFLQYDVIYYQTTLGEEVDKKIKNIRLLLPMGYEEIHLITTKSSGIKTLDDLKGKKVGVGSKYQGTLITNSYIKSQVNGKWKDVKVSFDKAFEYLEKGKIDAFFFVGAAPVAKFFIIPEKLKDNITMVPITNPELNDLYAKVTIKSGTYDWLSEDVETYAVRFALATNITDETEADKEELKKFLTEIQLHIGELKKDGHKMWKNVDFEFNRTIWDVHEVAIEVFNIKNYKNQF